MSSEKSAPPQYTWPPPSVTVGSPNSANAAPLVQSGYPGQPQGNPQYVLVPKEQSYVAPLNRPLQVASEHPRPQIQSAGITAMTRTLAAVESPSSFAASRGP